jgi:hypothetical protein
MIITANTVIDNSHRNAFIAECKKYDKTEGVQTFHQGTGDLEGTTIGMKHIRTPQGNGIMLIVSNDDEVILVCKLIAAPVNVGHYPWGRKMYVMDQIRVHNAYVGRGVAPMIYRWLNENGYTIISDSHQNGNSMAVWRKLAKTGGVYILNMEDHAWRPYNPVNVEDWMLFGNNDQSKYWNIRFVLPSR